MASEQSGQGANDNSSQRPPNSRNVSGQNVLEGLGTQDREIMSEVLDLLARGDDQDPMQQGQQIPQEPADYGGVQTNNPPLVQANSGTRTMNLPPSAGGQANQGGSSSNANPTSSNTGPVAGSNLPCYTSLLTGGYGAMSHYLPPQTGSTNLGITQSYPVVASQPMMSSPGVGGHQVTGNLNTGSSQSQDVLGASEYPILPTTASAPVHTSAVGVLVSDPENYVDAAGLGVHEPNDNELRNLKRRLRQHNNSRRHRHRKRRRDESERQELWRLENERSNLEQTLDLMRTHTTDELQQDVRVMEEQVCTDQGELDQSLKNEEDKFRLDWRK